MTNNEGRCLNRPGTCHQALCACDEEFARFHSWVANEYNDDFKTSPYGDFDKNAHCEPVTHEEPVYNQCCYNDEGAAFMYNPNNKCCKDGWVYPIGMC